MKAIMYVAHGSRLPEKNREFRAFVAKIIQKRPEPCQKIAFLEKEDETMPLVGEAMIQEGATEITVVPMLLFPAMHATKDIPEHVVSLKSRHPNVTFRIADTFGAEPETIATAAARIRDAKPESGATILVIAHGSASYDEPRIQMQGVITELSTQLGRKVALGMLHGEPNYKQVAAKLTGNVYWMPYFLFTGQLVDKIRAGINEISPNWRETSCLELDSNLATGVLRKIEEATS
ncbi:sirohydrochlorin chelatase [Listeria rustica]|uniref:Sirohydrochlorin chelatase n=1 Tax=Listeria rustica TaxID=2713503 RepID=A0A7W1YGN7_9LIST|nr:sirohydrochlorin chelatase [Listeria rustica]MBA3926823.1 sirohydrochlorin chelatase [Listeria rustica]